MGKQQVIANLALLSTDAQGFEAAAQRAAFAAAKLNVQSLPLQS